MKITINHIRNLQTAARNFLKLTEGSKIFAFYGEMGAGKTTVIKAICRELGATKNVTSPTFTLVNEYITTVGKSVFHIDCYRVEKREEALDFGIEEYLSGDSYCFIEWPEIIESILPMQVVKVRINVGRNEQRILKIE